MDGPLPKWCPAVALSRQDDRHSAVALLLKAALIQVSDYRLLGASGFFTIGKTGNSRSWYFIFEISGKPSFVEAVKYDELLSFSIFFALNFDKKLAVE